MVKKASAVAAVLFLLFDLVLPALPSLRLGIRDAEAAAPAGQWSDANYQYRQKITVTAGTAAVPNGYSVSVAFDHASLVSAGKSLTTGNDVRVFYWNGTSWVELDRVLDSGSSWNNAATTIWFQTQAAIGASGSNDNYYLYYGYSSATSPPANKANVFLFTDDFEAGNLNKWTKPGGTSAWGVGFTHNHTVNGSTAAVHAAVTTTSHYLEAYPALNEANVYVDAWWYLQTPSSGYDISQYLRSDTQCYTDSCYGTEMTTGWDVFKRINGGKTEVSAKAGTPTYNAWTRVGTRMYGTTFCVLRGRHPDKFRDQSDPAGVREHRFRDVDHPC